LSQKFNRLKQFFRNAHELFGLEKNAESKYTKTKKSYNRIGATLVTIGGAVPIPGGKRHKKPPGRNPSPP
jgi:hypothetical protein